MKRTVIPRGGPVKWCLETPNGLRESDARGLVLLNSPLLNKGTAFSVGERKALGLTGLLPPNISTLDTQVKSAYVQYERLPDALGKNIYLTALHDHNEVLFYRLLSEHLMEMIPAVNGLAFGAAMEAHQHDYRRPRGVHLSIDHAQSIEDAFANFGAGPKDIDLILATDAECIPGIGDRGAEGMPFAVSKLAIHTAAGGIDPKRVIPVMLDVGTDRESLRHDPLYVGNRHARIRGERYDAFIEAYISIVAKRFPHALLLWEGFAPGNGKRIVERYRSKIRTFDEDIQCAGSVLLAATLSATRAAGTLLRGQRIVVFGTGMAAAEIVGQLRDLMVNEGLSKQEAAAHFWHVDGRGSQTTGAVPQPLEDQETHTLQAAATEGRAHDPSGYGACLAEVVSRVRPTILIGASAVPGSFTRTIVKEMAAHAERPVVFMLSNSPAQAEASPADLIAWSGGRALVAAGGAFAPVTYRGVTYAVAQLNNAMLYPGLALGAIVSRASKISDGMLVAAARALSSLVTVRQPGASLLPQIDDLRNVSVTVAAAVAETAIAEGLAGVMSGDIVEQVRAAMWVPEYRQTLAW